MDRPITIDDQHIFGGLYDTERERQRQASGSGIPSYINYLVGAEQFLKNGGDINDEGDLWTMPTRRLAACAFFLIFASVFKGSAYGKSECIYGVQAPL